MAVISMIKNNPDALSPISKAFIKACRNPKPNPHKDPPCKEVDLNVPVSDIEQEIIKIKDLLVAHRDDASAGWSSFCIHGKSHDATREDDHYKDSRPHQWTEEAIKNMPKTIEWLKSLNYKSFERVRVMCLAPKGFIDVHRDQAHSSLKGAVNVAITHPKGCKFYLEHHGELKFTPGKSYSINLVNFHCVTNDSDQYRYHIIIHGTK